MKKLTALTVLVFFLFASMPMSKALMQSSDMRVSSLASKSIQNLPKNAVVGSTEERKAAWNKLSDTQKTEASERLKKIIEKAKTRSETITRETEKTLITFSNDFGASRNVSVSINPNDNLRNGDSGAPALRPIDPCDYCEPPDPTPTPVITPTPAVTPTPTPLPGIDADVDSLDDDFENNLADGFTPLYYVSANENSGTGFATFNNSVPQTVSQVFGSTPPISHFRVKPLGFGYINGVQYGFIQLDYLTLWNRDDGLVCSPICYVLAPSIGISLDEVGAHNLDNERSAALVAAPVINGGYDTNVYNYSAYEFFTAAHEDTFFDSSLLFYPQQPINFGGHINLALSLSKHGTYPYNPDYQPLVPNYIINITYYEIDNAYNYGEIDFYTYLSLLYTADTVFFACVVEHFHDQGGTYSGTRINVGELAHPINGSGFIQDAELTYKLQKQF